MRRINHETAQPIMTSVPVDVAALQNQLATAATRRLVREQDGVAYGVSVLTLDADGRLAVELPDAADPASQLQIGVNREFLLQGPGRIWPKPAGPGTRRPITPLALGLPDD